MWSRTYTQTKRLLFAALTVPTFSLPWQPEGPNGTLYRRDPLRHLRPPGYDRLPEPLIPVPAYSPAQGCDKLYPIWIAHKVAQLMTRNDNLIMLLNGDRQWKWPVMSSCRSQSVMDVIENRIRFICIDNYYRQLEILRPRTERKLD